MNQNLPQNSSKIKTRHSIAELLMNEDGAVMDYALIYPYFENRLNEGEYIRYGIHLLPPYDQSNIEIGEFIFETAEEAEDFLIEELDMDLPPQN